MWLLSSMCYLNIQVEPNLNKTLKVLCKCKISFWIQKMFYAQMQLKHPVVKAAFFYKQSIETSKVPITLSIVL